MATWLDILDFLAWIEGDLRAGTPYETQDLSVKYSQAQRVVLRMLPALSPVERRRMRDGVIAVAKEHDLSMFQAFALLRKLNRLRNLYDMGEGLKRATVASAKAVSLTAFLKSVQRIVKWGQSAKVRDRDALQHLTEAVQDYIRTSTLPKAEREAAGIVLTFYRRPEGDFTGDNVSGALAQWFLLAKIISDVADAEVPRLTEAQNERATADGNLTPIVRLVGGELPTLFERIQVTKFTRTRPVEKADEERSRLEIANTPSIRFVVACLYAMGLGTYAPETVSRHRTEFLTAEKAGRA